jgi:hypothetical protein
MKTLVILLALSLGLSVKTFAQCAPAACAGTSIQGLGGGNQTIPAGTTYYVPSGYTWTGNVSFTNLTSILCIDGTWTGTIAAASPNPGTINVNGTVSNATTWSFNGGGTVDINIKTGATFNITGFTISGGTFNITNCGTLTLTGNSTINGGTVLLDNYGSLILNGTFSSSTGGFTFHAEAGSDLRSFGAGTALSFSAGTFINDAHSCFKNNITFSGGTITNNACLSLQDVTINGSAAFTNNSVLNVNGNYNNS